MKKKYFLSIYIFVIQLFSSCSVLDAFESTKIKRYKTAEHYDLKAKDSLVTMNLFGSKISKKKNNKSSINLWGLTNKGQSELIDVLDKRFKENSSFIKSLEKKYFKIKGNGIKTDYTVKNIKMIFSISKLKRYDKMDNDIIGYSTADRIEYFKFKLKLPDDDIIPIKFKNWNKFETEYGSVNIADVSFNRTFSLSGGIGLSSSKSKSKTQSVGENSSVSGMEIGLVPNISANPTNSFGEKQKISSRFLALNGKLADKFIEIEQEGIREIDLSGNIVVDVILKFDYFTEDICHIPQLFKDNEPLRVEKIKLNLISVKIPNYLTIPKKVYVDLNYEYVYRHVKNKKGRRTFYEWDDKVNYFSGENKKKGIVLFDKEDYLPSFNQIGFYEGDSTKTKVEDKKSFVHLKLIYKYKDEKNASSDREDLLFQDSASSELFIDWLIAVSSKLENEYKKVRKEKKTGYKLKLKELKKNLKKQIIIGNYKLFTSGGEKVSKKYIFDNRNKLRPYQLY